LEDLVNRVISGIVVLGLTLFGLLVTPAAQAAPPSGDAVTLALTEATAAHALRYGGKQTAVNEVSWQNGRVVMTFPMPGSSRALSVGEQPVTAGTANCPTRYSCLYAAMNFDGRRLQFADCYQQSLRDFGFENQTTSWHSNKPRDVHSRVYDDDSGIRVTLWTSQGGARSSNVGAVKNDRADLILPC
jgi:hypothetical protein